MLDFKKSCVYQVYPKSFRDTNGDGIGDIKGITQSLDYLKELGVDYLWSTPFFLSPQNDNGYDVSDYRRIDPRYGTMADLEELIAEAQKREIGMMFDMVFNHTSTAHEWFQKALAGDPYYKDFYFFKKGKEDGSAPTNWISKFGGSAWEYVEQFDEYYLHLFDKTQADLNWDNPHVRDELKAILRFWMDKGIRGFRFDVVNLISKPELFADDHDGDGRRFYTDGHRVHEFLKELSGDSGMYERGMLTVGEMSSTSMENCIRYSNPQERELSMCFSFHHLKVDYKDQQKWALQDCDFESLKSLLYGWQTGMEQGDGWNAVFWCNHDQPRAVSRFGDDEAYHKESAKMLASMIHFMRGTPYIYQGEEIGMTNAKFTSIEQYRDVESLNYFEILKEQGIPEDEVYHILNERSRDNARTPMQWDKTEYAGFSKVEPWLSVNKNYQEINVEDNRKDHDSIFAFYQKLVRLRKEYDVIAYGSFEPILEDHPALFAYKRSYQGETLIALNNFYGEAAAVKLDFIPKGYRLLTGNYDDISLAPEMVLRPYETAVFIRQN